MPLPKTEYIWMNGEFINWDDAKIHVLSHVLHYGTSWFEGIRAYKTSKGVAVFRLQEHMKRLHNSVKMYHSNLPYTVNELCEATLEIIRKNKLESCYIRPLAYRGYGELGVYPLECPMEVIIAAWKWGVYLGTDAHEKGVDVCVSSWRRLAPSTMPTLSKAGGNYMNAQLIRMEANKNGYHEGIGLDTNGYVSEGSGENIFIVQDGKVYTPGVGSSILQGVTRESVTIMLKEQGIDVIETVVPRGLLYSADEIFFTGTAVEITPVRSIDRIAVGDGHVGPITRIVQKAFNSVVNDGIDPHRWLTYI